MSQSPTPLPEEERAVRLDGEFAVARPALAVGERLRRIERLAACVPGIQTVERTAVDGVVADMLLELAFVRLPTCVEGRLERAGERDLDFALIGTTRTLAGRFQASVHIAWSGTAEASTRVSYRLDVTLKGRLASLGEAMVRAAAEGKAREFEANLATMLEAP